MIDLDRLDALRTAVPWFYDDGPAHHDLGDETCEDDCRGCAYESAVGTAYPELRDELVRLREENAKLRKALDRLERSARDVGTTFDERAAGGGLITDLRIEVELARATLEGKNG